jgi:hypothetical protein
VAGLRRLYETGGRRWLVLLCFENVLAGKRCHRRTFADWWYGRMGQRVPELDPEDFGAQQRLF